VLTRNDISDLDSESISITSAAIVCKAIVPGDTILEGDSSHSDILLHSGSIDLLDNVMSDESEGRVRFFAHLFCIVLCFPYFCIH